MSAKQQTNGARTAAPPEHYTPGWLAQLDGRYNLSRDMRARYAEVCSDLGGVDQLSYMQRSLVERALWLEYWLAQQERSLARGDMQGFDVGKWVQAANSLQGIYSRLGLERRQRQIGALEWVRRQADAQAAEGAGHD